MISTVNLNLGYRYTYMHVMGLGEGDECCERGVGCMINPHTCLEECRHIDMFVCRQDVHTRMPWG